jgi:hypothetical protein
VTFQFKLGKHAVSFFQKTLASIQLSELYLAAQIVWHNHRVNSCNAQPCRIHQPYRLPVQLQFTHRHSVRSIGFFFACKWHTLSSNSGFDVISKSSTAGAKFCILSALVNTFNQTFEMSVSGTKPELHKVLTSFHVFHWTYSLHPHKNLMAMQCYIFGFLMDQHLVRANQTVMSHLLHRMWPVMKLYSCCIFLLQFQYCLFHTCGPGSSVGIATAYGLDGPGIEYQWRRDFPHLSRPALRPTQPPVEWVTVPSRQ